MIFLINIITHFFSGITEGFLKWILLGVISSSYWICLYICIGAIILYIAGIKKAGKYASASIIIYFICQCLRVAL